MDTEERDDEQLFFSLLKKQHELSKPILPIGASPSSFSPIFSASPPPIQPSPAFLSPLQQYSPPRITSSSPSTSTQVNTPSLFNTGLSSVPTSPISSPRDRTKPRAAKSKAARSLNLKDVRTPIQSIFQLPQELVLYVFGFITDMQDILNLRLTCKAWSVLAIYNKVWKKFAWKLIQYWHDWSKERSPNDTDLFYETISVLKKMRTPTTREIQEQDLFLPRENIRKVMKSILPPDVKVARDALDCVQECATEFILFVLCEAAEIAASKKKKTLSGQNTVEAMETLGLDNYATLMAIYLDKLGRLIPKRDHSAKGKRKFAEISSGDESNQNLDGSNE